MSDKRASEMSREEFLEYINRRAPVFTHGYEFRGITVSGLNPVYCTAEELAVVEQLRKQWEAAQASNGVARPKDSGVESETV